MNDKECPQCHYQPEKEKNENKKSVGAQSFYKAEPEKVEECPQCHYQPESEVEKTEECPQCHYIPEKEEK